MAELTRNKDHSKNSDTFIFKELIDIMWFCVSKDLNFKGLTLRTTRDAGRGNERLDLHGGIHKGHTV